MIRRVCICCIGLVCGLLVPLSVDTAYASTGTTFPPCKSTQTSPSWYTGIDNSPNPITNSTPMTNLHATSAVIGTDNPQICNPTSLPANEGEGLSTVWVGLFSTGSSAGLAQDGWSRDYPQSQPSYFAEYIPPLSQCCHNLVYLGSPAIGSYHTYEVAYDYNYNWTFYIDGGVAMTAKGGWTPKGYEDWGEVHDTEDQMPGGTSQYLYFKQIQCLTSQWGTPPIYTYNSYSPARTGYSGSTGWIYDTRFSS